ncbi:MAG: cytochrome c maturation protein CcmE [Spirochaetes bacterium]|nr:cytochrome c maturation protein CcmE [Spirochaetota bacterium]
MNFKNLLFAIIFISVFCGIILMSMDAISPYVSISDAKKNSKTVQIIGKPAGGIPLLVPELSSFYVTDADGGRIFVVYDKNLPVNFKHSEKIVIIGKYSIERNLFVADNILLKCPSKYEDKLTADEE